MMDNRDSHAEFSTKGNLSNNEVAVILLCGLKTLSFRWAWHSQNGISKLDLRPRRGVPQSWEGAGILCIEAKANASRATAAQ